MLQNLHVKNLALIDEMEVEFQSGLNILTGETGAGKSIILGSIHLALGGKYSPDMLRKGVQYGMVELTFSVPEEMQHRLQEMDIFTEDGMLVLSRRLMEGRSISKINGETVNMGVLRDVASILIDIHGQHEHQTLLHKQNHLAILDAYAKEQTVPLLKQVANACSAYRDCKKALAESSLDEAARQKEIILLEFEVKEIEEAGLRVGEDEELEQKYARMQSGKKVTEGIGEAYEYTSEAQDFNASDALSRAIRSLQVIADCDEKGDELYNQLVEIDSLLNDFNRELSEYAKSFDFSEEEFYETEARLNTLNHLKSKYGDSVTEILGYYDRIGERLIELRDYEEYIEKLEKKQKDAAFILEKCSEELSQIRKESAVSFANKVEQGLQELNFLQVQFEMQFERLSDYTTTGFDEAQFYISTNPGEPLKQMSMVASGGELSRIMLAIKTVLAEKEEIPTLIFDEIDAGISGITAGKVAEKMQIIGKTHQVICITHLPQIAAMADAHYVIEKTVEQNVTKTTICLLEEADSIRELARILGGTAITDTILKSAKELKELAKCEK